MTDNDKAARDAAWENEIGVPRESREYCRTAWVRSWAAAIAHAEAMHAERVKSLVDTMESIPYSAYGFNEAAIQMMDMVQEFAKKHRGKE